MNCRVQAPHTVLILLQTLEHRGLVISNTESQPLIILTQPVLSLHEKVQAVLILFLVESINGSRVQLVSTQLLVATLGWKVGSVLQHSA